MKIRIIKHIRTKTAAENCVQNTLQNCVQKIVQNPLQNCEHKNVQNTVLNRETDGRKNKAPAHLHDQMKTGTRGIYMFVPQMNKITGRTYPDGDVLHIEGIYDFRRCVV